MITLKILGPRCLTMARSPSNLVTRFCSAQKVETGTPGKKKIYVDSRWFFVPAKFLMAVMVYGGVYVGYTKYQQRQQREAKCEAVEEKAGFAFKMTKYEGCVLPKDFIISGKMGEVEHMETRPEDVFVASFPKSGTTWLQQVVFLLYHPPIETEDGRTLPHPESHKNIEERFPFLENFWPGITEIKNRQGRRLIKTHLPVHLLPKSIKESKTKVLYISRNPKDVIVSYYHFAKMLTLLNYKGTLEDFAWLVMLEQMLYCPLFFHVEGYMKVAQAKPDQFKAVSYEDMKSNPEREIRKIADFLKIPVSKDRIREIAQETSFEAMKSNPTTNYSHWDSWLRNKNEADFMRKGQVGDYKNHFGAKMNATLDEWIELYSKKHPLVKFKYELQKE